MEDHMKRLIIPLVCITVLMVCTSHASAQIMFGGQLSYADDTDLGVGVRAAYDLGVFIENLIGIGSFDLFFPDAPSGVDHSYWELNANAAYPIPIEGLKNISLYAGGGLNISHCSFSIPGFGDEADTDLGLNLLAGSLFKLKGKLTPFVEIRLELGGGEQFVLSGGVYF